MSDDELWAAIDRQRLRTADLLEDLTAADWDRPSLCDGWTVRDVAGHLTMQQLTLGEALRIGIRHPGGINQLINVSARERASLPTDQLIAQIRGMVGSRRHNVGVTPLETLIDIVVHGQDIAIPLGRTLEVEPDVAVTAAARAWSYQFSRRQRKKSQVFRTLPYAGCRLVASDTDWAVGSGPEIGGTTLALLLLLTGRSAVIPQLDGEGCSALGSS